MERRLEILQASSATVSHVLGLTNAGIGNICQGTFMNVPQYVFVKVQLAIWFQAGFSHTTLATRNLLRPAHCIQQWITHKERSTSHFTLEEVGWFSDMSASRLPEYSSLIVSTVNGKATGNTTSIFCRSVTCLGTDQCWNRKHMPGHVLECSAVLACKGAACDLVSSKPFPHNTCNLHVALPYRLNPRNSLRTRKVGSETHLRWAV